MILSVTGHRPEKLKLAPGPAPQHIITALLRTLQPDRVVTGMARGWDMDVAEVASHLDIPITAAVPCGVWIQRNKWGPVDMKRHHELIGRCDRVEIIMQGPYTPHAFKARNEWMVVNSDCLAAMYDGSPSGTGHCVRYAERIGKPVIQLWGLPFN